MVVTAYYDNETSAVISDYTTNYDSEAFKTTGDVTVTVSYGGKTDTFTVNVKEDTITAIEVTTPPTVTEYWYSPTLESDLDTSGMVVTAKRASGKTGTLSSGDYTVAIPKLVVGENTITVRKGITADSSVSDTFTVTVKDFVGAINVTTDSSFQTDYYFGGHTEETPTLNTAGLIVTPEWASGAVTAITGWNAEANLNAAGDNVAVTVTYVNQKGETLTNTKVSVKVVAPAITALTIDASQVKTVYYVGDSLDISNLTAKVKYENCPVDCSGHSVEVTADMVSGFDSSAEAESQTLTVIYGEQSATYAVRIKEDVLTDIALNTTELHAIEGDAELNISAVKITEVWASGKAGADITEDCEFALSAVDLTTVGTYTVTVTYGEFTKEITVTVAEADKLTAIEVSPDELIFTVGDTLDLSAVVVNEVYASGAKKTLTADDYNVDASAVKMDTVGEYEIKITHKGNTALTDTVKVTVRAKYLPWNPGTPWYPNYRPETPVVDTKPANGWNGDKYYQNGTAVKGWLELFGNWYYFDRAGSMVTGWVEVDDAWYYMNSNGKMATGWLQWNGSWYYLKSSGAMVTGWYKVDGTWYYFSGSGAMKTGWVMSGGKWYFLKDSGAMATGWLQWKGDWYYLNTPNGDMAVDTKTPDGYYVNADGIWVK